MATIAQINANRANAKKSTGPRTPEGKAVSSGNRITHGLCADQHLLIDEDTGAYVALCHDLFDRFHPVGDSEENLVMRIASAQWRLDRALRIETQIYRQYVAKIATPGAPREELRAETEMLGDAFAIDAGGSQSFLKLARYETSLERFITRTLGQLEDFRKARAQSPSSYSPAEFAHDGITPGNQFPALAPIETGEIAIQTQSCPASGCLPGDVVVHGAVDSFTPSPAGTLDIAIAGASSSEYSRLIVRGQAELSGVLNLNLIAGFVPACGDRFTILSAGRIMGQFSRVDESGIAGRGRFQIEYSPTEVTAIVAPSA